MQTWIWVINKHFLWLILFSTSKSSSPHTLHHWVPSYRHMASPTIATLMTHSSISLFNQMILGSCMDIRLLGRHLSMDERTSPTAQPVKDWASCLPCHSNSTAWLHDSVRFINNYPINFRNLGVIFDVQLTFKEHIAKTARSCRFALHNIR